jgi:hypothetical protein
LGSRAAEDAQEPGRGLHDLLIWGARDRVVALVGGAVMVAVMLLVIFDLDRPHRGFITIPSTALVAERASDGLAARCRRPRNSPP